MKKNLRIVALATFIALCGSTSITNAQSWTLTGNSNATSTSKLGTKNAQPLKVITNDTVRLFISKAGRAGMGIGANVDPNYQLYVKGASYGIKGEGGYYGVYGTGGSLGLYGYSAHGYGGEVISDSSDGFDAYSSHGYYGVYAYCPTYLGVYGYGGTYGVYGSGGTYGSYSYGISYGAYGTSNSGFGVDGNSYYGFGGYFHSVTSYAIEASSDSNYYAGVFFGHVYSSQGFVTSDRRLKKNIEDFSNAMSIINKLQPKYYEFKNDAQYAALHLPKGTHYGLLAQDLEQILPNLVHEENFKIPVNNKTDNLLPKTADGKDPNNYTTTKTVAQTENVDVKAVNYIELIPIMIKAMQEQDKKIDALTQQVNALTSGQSASASNITSTQLNNTFMQSIPNPAKNTASIVYNNLPVNSNTQLSISDANGKLIKHVQLNKTGNGVVNMDVSALSAGTYFYSLFINGKLSDTKQMQIVK